MGGMGGRNRGGSGSGTKKPEKSSRKQYIWEKEAGGKAAEAAKLRASITGMPPRTSTSTNPNKGAPKKKRYSWELEADDKAAEQAKVKASVTATEEKPKKRYPWEA
jgi:hypothetical protein